VAHFQNMSLLLHESFHFFADIWFMKALYFSLWMLCFLGMGERVLAQQYFRLLEALDKPYEQKIARFVNDDIVIGGSPITGATADQNGGLNLTRIDKCGNVRWAMNYQWKKNYMKFKDIKVNEKDEVFVYGTTYEGSEEFIFLLKLNKKGETLAFRVLHGGTVDNFTYNIQLKNNRIIAYGLLLDFNTSKRGFIFVFDQNLNYQWGKVFEPFESFGEAIITEDDGLLCRSGFYLVKLNAQGDLEWATVLEAEVGVGLYPITGPVEVNGGSIFEASYNNIAFFYKIDKNGKLVWKSPQFTATSSAADLITLPNGNLFAIYNSPSGTRENFPCQILLSPDGTILQQKKLNVSQSLQTASIYQSISDNRMVSVIGNTDIRATGRPSGFLLQFSLDAQLGKCFEWESFTSFTPNDKPITFTPLNVTFFESVIRYVEARITEATRDFSFEEGCDVPSVTTIRKDSVLSCGQNWQITLPDASFIWEDEVRGSTRVLEQPGTYRASNYDCISPLTYEYNVERIPCPCNIFLPTAFSPNDDGQNDKLELFSSCNINKLQYTIYNRWGNIVFETIAPNQRWDGFSKQKPAATGVYIVVIKYELLNETGETQQGSLVQNVTLVR